jgi:DNA-directed RNA polymerase subunit RPC12/RpoP
MISSYNKSKMVCPHCGSHNLAAFSTACPMYEINEDGSLGLVIVDENGIESINETTSEEAANMGYYCFDCHRSFPAEETDDGYTIDEEI